jgi:hypothetical protein
MTYSVSNLLAHPPLTLSTTTTVFTGTATLGTEGAAVVMRGQAGQPFGFFLPGTEPVEEGAETPAAWAEVYLIAMVMIGHPGMRVDVGVDQIAATFQPDPRGGTARWLHLGGVASAPLPLRIGYRVTLQQN